MQFRKFAMCLGLVTLVQANSGLAQTELSQNRVYKMRFSDLVLSPAQFQKLSEADRYTYLRTMIRMLQVAEITQSRVVPYDESTSNAAEVKQRILKLNAFLQLLQGEESNAEIKRAVTESIWKFVSNTGKRISGTADRMIEKLSETAVLERDLTKAGRKEAENVADKYAAESAEKVAALQAKIDKKYAEKIEDIQARRQEITKELRATKDAARMAELKAEREALNKNAKVAREIKKAEVPEAKLIGEAKLAAELKRAEEVAGVKAVNIKKAEKELADAQAELAKNPSSKNAINRVKQATENLDKAGKSFDEVIAAYAKRGGDVNKLKKIAEDAQLKPGFLKERLSALLSRIRRVPTVVKYGAVAVGAVVLDRSLPDLWNLYQQSPLVAGQALQLDVEANPGAKLVKDNSCVFGGHLSETKDFGGRMLCTRPESSKTDSCNGSKFQCPDYGITGQDGKDIKAGLCISSHKLDNLTIRCTQALDKILSAGTNWSLNSTAYEKFDTTLRTAMIKFDTTAGSVFEYCSKASGFAGNQKQECEAMMSILKEIPMTVVAVAEEPEASATARPAGAPGPAEDNSPVKVILPASREGVSQ